MKKMLKQFKIIDKKCYAIVFSHSVFFVAKIQEEKFYDNQYLFD